MVFWKACCAALFFLMFSVPVMGENYRIKELNIIYRQLKDARTWVEEHDALLQNSHGDKVNTVIGDASLFIEATVELLKDLNTSKYSGTLFKEGLALKYTSQLTHTETQLELTQDLEVGTYAIINLSKDLVNEALSIIKDIAKTPLALGICTWP